MPLRHSALTGKIIGAAIEVHKQLGPGFVEKIYQAALQRELENTGVPFAPLLEVTVSYRGAPVGKHILDLLVAQAVVVELKAVRRIKLVHVAFTRSYMRAAGVEDGLILNFSHGTLDIRRVVP